MAFPTNSIISLAVFVIFFAGFGPISTAATTTTSTSTTTTSTSKRTGCKDGWTFYAGDKTCLQVFGTGKNISDKSLNWYKARESCKTFGGDIVIIRDEDKSNFVFRMVYETVGLPWIGVMNNASLGYTWKYVDGSDLGSYHPWGPGQPVKVQDSRCVIMSTSKSNHGKWYNYTCYITQPYVCSTSSAL